MESNPKQEIHKITILPGDVITIKTDRPLYFYYQYEEVPSDHRVLEINL